MPNWTRSTAFRFVVAFAMTLGMLLSPVGRSASHDPAALAAAEAARHAELAAEVEDHGHVHDDGAEDEQSPGHSHGHNPADHSHETPNILAVALAPAVPVSRGWHPCPPVFAHIQASFRHERPPRLIFVA
ncbi:hypothetical protein V5F32_23320 [Xanthobacter oligotrophicus]|uniref:Secreted protein n=1 Tax=Xanthobacter oligotrophicus TaxID=2607286 RepID=A0ABW7A244_9HYPH